VPSSSRFGVGYCLGFVTILGIKNQMEFDVVDFINNMVAQLIAVASAGISFVIVPPAIGSHWFRRRRLDQLRRQVGMAATAPLLGLRSRFESLNHDLFGQIVAQTERGSQESRTFLAWALSVHEMGRTMIELRNEMSMRSLPGEVRGAITRAIDALAALYDNPGVISYEQASNALAAATVMTSRDESMRSLMDHLHLLRLALMDDQSVLAEYMRSKTPANGAAHAA
jgi:uncharacterized membrane protein YccC